MSVPKDLIGPQNYSPVHVRNRPFQYQYLISGLFMIEHEPDSQAPKVIRFYYNSKEYSQFSNLYHCRVDYKGRVWDSVERAYQYQKFKDRAIAEWLVEAPYDAVVTIAGHAFSLDRHEEYLVDNWAEIRVDIMRSLLEAKFLQNMLLYIDLQLTGNAILIEDAPTGNFFWGQNIHYVGKNMMGKLLMELRAKWHQIPVYELH